LSYLLDTNAVSEPGQPRPDLKFMEWFALVPEEDLFVSAVTLGEVRRGMSKLDLGPKRSSVERQYNAVLAFGARILPVDVRTAQAWGDLSARLWRMGRLAGTAYELIAATALVHDLTVVTRNARHFSHSGCPLLSPWSAQGPA
jgi:toxin FitB